MDTVQLMQWHTQFDDIMSSTAPDQLKLDWLRDLHSRTTEQPDMWQESIEEETERML